MSETEGLASIEWSPREELGLFVCITPLSRCSNPTSAVDHILAEFRDRILAAIAERMKSQ